MNAAMQTSAVFNVRNTNNTSISCSKNNNKDEEEDVTVLLQNSTIHLNQLKSLEKNIDFQMAVKKKPNTYVNVVKELY